MKETAYEQNLDAILADFSDFSADLEKAERVKKPRPAPAAPQPKPAPAPKWEQPVPTDATTVRPLRREEPDGATTVFPGSPRPAAEKRPAAPRPAEAKKPAPAKKAAPASAVRPKKKKASSRGAWLIVLAAALVMALSFLGYRFVEARQPAPETPQMHLMDSLDSYFPENPGEDNSEG